jgi:putative DNA primase/helicase
VPYQATRHGARASTTDPSTWATFEQALAGASTADGIGYVFSAGDPYVGIDLDGGLTDAERELIVLVLDSYAETSVSGTGVHVIVKARLNGHPRRHKGPVEVYESARYFCMTGARVPGARSTIEERQQGAGAGAGAVPPGPGRCSTSVSRGARPSMSSSVRIDRPDVGQ